MTAIYKYDWQKSKLIVLLILLVYEQNVNENQSMVLLSCPAWAGAKEYTVGSPLMLVYTTANQRAAFCFVILTCKPMAFWRGQYKAYS